MSIRSRILLTLAASSAVACAAEPDPGSEAYFSAFVRPILESACTHCHGKDEDKGDLRLHTLEAALAGADGKAANGQREMDQIRMSRLGRRCARQEKTLRWTPDL